MIRIPILQPGKSAAFPPAASALREPAGLLAAGGDLSAERLLDAYRHGIFPWFSDGQPILWWSPDPRMVFATDAAHVARRLRRRLKQCDWTIGTDEAFVQVMHECAAPRAGQRGTWIVAEMIDAYRRLHELGHAHSLEIRDRGRLIGGIYGVAIGRMFFGESMFGHVTNASKTALFALCRVLHLLDCPLLDAQVSSSHLTTLGAYEMPRETFLGRVAELSARPPPSAQLWRRTVTDLRVADLAD